MIDSKYIISLQVGDKFFLKNKGKNDIWKVVKIVNLTKRKKTYKAFIISKLDAYKQETKDLDIISEEELMSMADNISNFDIHQYYVDMFSTSTSK